MKFLAALFLSLFISATAMASGLEMFQTVINSDALKTLNEAKAAEQWSLVKVENTATYRCPQCFDYEVTFTKYDSSENKMIELKKTLHTSYRIGGDVTVRVQE